MVLLRSKFEAEDISRFQMLRWLKYPINLPSLILDLHNPDLDVCKTFHRLPMPILAYPANRIYNEKKLYSETV